MKEQEYEKEELEDLHKVSSHFKSYTLKNGKLAFERVQRETNALGGFDGGVAGMAGYVGVGFDIGVGIEGVVGVEVAFVLEVSEGIGKGSGV